MAGRGVIIAMCALLNSAQQLGANLSTTGPAIVPQPAELQLQSGTCALASATVIRVDFETAGVRVVGEFLADQLRAATGQTLPVQETDEPVARDGVILLTLAGAPEMLGDEGYELSITPQSVMLRARTARGLIYGVQTLRQLLTLDAQAAAAWPCLKIVDRPRYAWRGMLLDCGRHFMSKEFVKRYIDLLSYHKLNVLHWHLTEDQGWRIEIKKYPKLTEVGAWRTVTRDSEQERDDAGRYGGFYTQDDVREIVAYAASRGITVVPEIEMPGHSLAALAAYPELSCTGGPFQVRTEWGITEDVYCAGNDQTFAFLEDVLTEVLPLFPSEFIHIGGDECPKARWQACPKCQARIQAEGLKDERELQSYFIRRIERFLNSHNRRLIGWDEILEGGLAPNATVQAWRSLDHAVTAARAGHDVICSPTSHCYIDYPQYADPARPEWMGFITLEKSYAFEPTPAGLTPEQARHVLGLEGTMWTERTPMSRVDHQVFPRMCALAEAAWSPAETRNAADFARRMDMHYARLEALGVTYCVPPPRLTHPQATFTESVTVEFAPPFRGGEIRYTTDGSEPDAKSPQYQQPLKFTETTMIRARTILPSGNASDAVEIRFAKLAAHAPVVLPKVVPGLSYEYYEGRWNRLPQFAKFTPAAIGQATGFDLAVRLRDAQFALRFTGFIEVPTDGTYTFYLKSDDGSRLLIGTDAVVDNDGLHAAEERRGEVLLQAGRHPLTIEYFQAGGALALEISYEGPGLPRQALPNTVLFRVP
ncbi:MAG: family 20 glycosylhydrolase [Phycisphaerae bacterium]|nr:family 20 glycosylhydrolase [Phycisphaerae bacterium]